MNTRRLRSLLLVLLGVILAGLIVTSAQFQLPFPPLPTPVLPRPVVTPGLVPTPILPTPESDEGPQITPEARTPEPSPPAESAWPQNARAFYVDSRSGNDDHTGGSPEQAWRTLTRLEAMHLAPGDAVFLARGSQWQDSLLIEDSGTADAPILLSAYGEGPRPVIEPADEQERPLTIDGSWVEVEGLLIRNSRSGGINITRNGQRNTLRDLEITEVGIGVEVYGPFNRITGNSIHDLRMVRNTPGGDDDYGALGVLLASQGNEVGHNTFVNCRGLSFDYKLDGGAVELYGDGVDNNIIHHNVGNRNDGFIEVGGGSAANNLVAYNVSYNSNGRFAWFNLQGKFAAQVENLVLVNNTIVETEPPVAPGILWFGSVQPTPEMLQVYNNIFYLNRVNGIANQQGYGHDHNLYFLLDPNSTLGQELGEGEIFGDPLFVDPARADFRLRPDSPGLGAGRKPGPEVAVLGAAPTGDPPDLGALPFSG